jgi:hypothetical protein
VVVVNHQTLRKVVPLSAGFCFWRHAGGRCVTILGKNIKKNKKIFKKVPSNA